VELSVRGILRGSADWQRARLASSIGGHFHLRPHCLFPVLLIALTRLYRRLKTSIAARARLDRETQARRLKATKRAIAEIELVLMSIRHVRNGRRLFESISFDVTMAACAL